MEADRSRPIAEVRDLQAAYRHNGRLVNVLDRISFELKRGEIVALLGESGSGKSTIARAMMGLLPPSASGIGGSLRIGDAVCDRLSDSRFPWERIRGRELGMLFQDARQALHPLMKIREQFAETLLFHRKASAREVPSIAVRMLSMLHFDDPERVLDCYPFELSGGMCQRVCLALALCLEPKALVADEPTSALDTVSQREVLELLRRLQRELGLAVLLITHDIGVASAVSDRIIVLHRGSIVEEGDTKSVLRLPRSEPTRRLLASRSQIGGASPPALSSSLEALLEVRRLEKRFAAGNSVLREVSLTMRKGETLGILGESGSGKSTLARCIAGLETPSGGRILYKGKDIGAARGREGRQIRRAIQFIFQDARASLNPSRTALQLVQEPLRYMRIGSKKERLETAHAYLQAVGLDGDALHRRPPQLSTGQCQRIAIARALAPGPDVLLCDEAVSALDMSIQAQILALLQRLQEQFGFSMMMISHDIRVLRSCCQRIAVMERGTVTEVRPSASLQESERPYTQRLLACAGETEGEFIPEGEEANDGKHPGPDRRDAARDDSEQQPSGRRASVVEV